MSLPGYTCSGNTLIHFPVLPIYYLSPNTKFTLRGGRNTSAFLLYRGWKNILLKLKPTSLISYAKKIRLEAKELFGLCRPWLVMPLGRGKLWSHSKLQLHDWCVDFPPKLMLPTLVSLVKPPRIHNLPRAHLSSYRVKYRLISLLFIS